MPGQNFFKLGEALAGGNQSSRDSAFYQGQKAATESQHLSAQTQEALARANSEQIKARAAQKEQDEALKLGENLFTLGVVDTPEKGNALASAMRGGFAKYSDATQGALRLQEKDFRTTLGDPHAPIGDQLAASAGIKGESPTPAISNFNYGETLTPEQRTRFNDFSQPPKFVSAGGVPVNARTGAPVVPVGTVAQNAAAITGAKTEATGLAKRTLDLPAANLRAASSDAKFQGLSDSATTLLKDDKLWEAVGLAKSIAAIPGTEGAYIRAKLNTLKAKVGFAVLQDMRDSSKTGGALGQVSDQENKYLQNAIAALDENLAPADFREQLQVLVDYASGARGRIKQAFVDTYPEIGRAPKPTGAPASGAAPTSKPKTVTQNGFTYTLNEATGEYE